jgi:hypothetical protein
MITLDKWYPLVQAKHDIQTVAFDKVEVVPMSAPIGKLFYLDYVYKGYKGLEEK